MSKVFQVPLLSMLLFPSFLLLWPLAPPMPRSFVHGLGYTVTGDALISADRKAAWDRVDKVLGGEGGGGGIKFHGFSLLFLTYKMWKNNGPIPP